MDATELKTILKKHADWLENNNKGERADLKGADLKGADLKGADLKWADLKGADLKGADLKWAYLEGAYLEGADLKWAYLEGADLKGADLKWADLKGADLKWADLKGADLDFSSGFSFRCSSFDAIIDLRIGAQMAYHFCRMKSGYPEVIEAQQAIKKLANKFHRVNECGKIK